MQRFSVALLTAAFIAYWPALAVADEQAPLQSTLNPHAAPAALIAGLTWWMIAVFSLVFILVMLLGGFGIFRGLGGKGARLTDSASRNLVILGGVVIPLLVLVGFTVGSLLVGQASSRAYPDAALTVEVIGNRWWWEIRYYDRDERLLAVTANELHVPSAQPVKLLHARDVIHSFWAPNLDGKTDMIPGMTNVAWLNVPQPGIYRGQCAEYCGTQHSLMAFAVIAQPAEAFQRWLDHQSRPAVATALAHEEGRRVFASSGCADCHSIRGTHADGELGPDLTHLASRQTLAAATLPNTRGHLGGWISDPQSSKPGALMPATAMQPQELEALLDYLQALE